MGRNVWVEVSEIRQSQNVNGIHTGSNLTYKYSNIRY